MASNEMSTFSSENHQVTMWDMYITAAKFMFGDNITVFRTPLLIQSLSNLCFTIRVEAADQQIMEKTKTTVDITTKEYSNHSEKEMDQTQIKVKKNYTTSKESQFHFSPSNGVNWGIGGNIGAKVMGLSMSGGSAMVGGMYSKYQSRAEDFNADFHFSYRQEEKVNIPPLSRVKVKITSYAIKYEQSYTLRFSIPASYLIEVKYQTRYNRICCGTHTGYITAAQLLQTLPSYHEQNGMSIFYQHGVLSWMGEERNVDKIVEQIGSVDLLQ